MNKLFIVTVAHMDREIIYNSLNQFIRTTTLQNCIKKWVFVDNCWPLKKEQTTDALINIAHALNSRFPCTVIKPDNNLGGHGGVNLALDHLKATHTIDKDDLILIYDPDSVPEQQGWLTALQDVMNFDKSMAYLSLTHEAIKGNFKDNVPVMGGGIVSEAVDVKARGATEPVGKP